MICGTGLTNQSQAMRGVPAPQDFRSAAGIRRWSNSAFSNHCRFFPLNGITSYQEGDPEKDSTRSRHRRRARRRHHRHCLARASALGSRRLGLGPRHRRRPTRWRRDRRHRLLGLRLGAGVRLLRRLRAGLLWRLGLRPCGDLCTGLLRAGVWVSLSPRVQAGLRLLWGPISAPRLASSLASLVIGARPGERKKAASREAAF
jgi:hypothetical protein